MSWVAVGVAGVSLVGGLISSGAQKRKAKNQLDQLNKNQPVEALPNEVTQNQELATLRSNTGLPSEQYNQAMKNIQRQQMASLKAASDRKMGLGLISSLDDNANTAIGNLDAANAKARLQNQNQLMGINNQVANWKKGIFDRNVRQVWNRNYDYSMGLLGQGNQNQANVINSSVGLAGTALMGKYGSGLLGSRKSNNTGTNDPLNGYYNTSNGDINYE